MDDLLNLLRSKYNYGDDLLNFLGTLIPIMIEYFGVEYKDKIISSFLETPIIMTNNTIGKEIGSDDPNLLLAGGVYCYEINVENNNPSISSKVVIPNSPIKPFDFENVRDVGHLVHELCHMVKCGLIINFEENIIINYCGLNQTIGSIDNNEFSTQSSNDARGLDEALNAIDEILIMQKIYPDYELTSNYKRLVSYIWAMIDGNVEFLNCIRQSQFNGSSDYREYLGIEISEKLIKLCNMHYDLTVNRIFELINNENLQKELEDIEKELIDIIRQINEISSKQTL